MAAVNARSRTRVPIKKGGSTGLDIDLGGGNSCGGHGEDPVSVVH